MPALPPAVFDLLAGVDLILHAGDLSDPAILVELRRVAPVQAVRGNLHLQAPWPNDQRLPLTLDLEIKGRRTVVTHGHISLWKSFLEKLWMFVPDHHRHLNRILAKRVARAFPGADVYVFGHTHQALVERWEGALFVNPGAVCPTRRKVSSVARLQVMAGGAEAEILPLDRG
jgi:putative phosphoesterase